MSYAADHAEALADVADAGASVTFTLSVPGSYDAATDTSGAATVTTVAGSAVRDGGNPETYARLQLVASEAPTLLFTPTTYGQLPPLGAKVTWGGDTFTVRDVLPIAPDGTAIAAYVVIAR